METISALLLSSDAGVLGLTNRIFDDYGFEVEVAPDVRTADALLRRRSFDLGVFDNDVPGAVELAGRKNSGNPRVIFAMVSRENSRDVQGKRVHFVVPKPFSTDFFLRNLKAAYGVMLREKRAAFRQDVRIPATAATLIHDGAQRSLGKVVIVNLSKTGLGLTAGEMVPQGATVQLTFPMPDSGEPLTVSGAVVWVFDSGRAGVRFSQVSPAVQKKLGAWIDSKLPGESEFVPHPGAPARARVCAETLVAEKVGV